MRLSAAATVGTLVALALTLSACGQDGGTAAGGPTQTASATSTASTAPAATAATAMARRSCRHALGPFLTSLAALRDDLARGLSYDDYLARIRDTRAIYAEIRPDRIPAGCLVVNGGPAERAFNLYIDAANAWGDCLAEVSCNTRSVEPELQRKWALAEDRIADSKHGLSFAPGG